MKLGWGRLRWTERDEDRLGYGLCILAALYFGGHILVAALKAAGWF